MEDLAQGGKRSERFDTIATRVNDLHGRMPALARVCKEHLPKIRPTMFSAPDIIVVGVLALLLFGPERLPGLMRGAGRVMRDVRNTSQSFVAEMERAADYNEPVTPVASVAPITSVSSESTSSPITPPSEPLP